MFLRPILEECRLGTAANHGTWIVQDSTIILTHTNPPPNPKNSTPAGIAKIRRTLTGQANAGAQVIE